MFSLLGRWFINKSLNVAQMFLLMKESLHAFPALIRQRPVPQVQVILKQIYFTGFESLKVIVPISMAIGTVIITQIIALVGSGNESLSAKVLVWTVVRELGPLLTALIVIARSGAAIATELGTMKINGEIDALEGLGIPVIDYLILPRIFGVTIAVFVLMVYFEIGAIFGGFLVASFGWNMPFDQFAQGIYAALSFSQLFQSAVKGLCFGAIVSAACCQQGLSVGRSATMVPQAATKGVMHSLFLVFFLDGIITFLAQHWQGN